MDFGDNMTETFNESSQPVEAVAAETEATEVKPQTEATEQPEFYVDVEDDHKPSNMSQEQTYAAWKAEKEKRLKKQKIIDEQKAELEALKSQLSEVQNQVSTIAKGAPPTLESCDYDEDLFRTKVAEYYSNQSQQKAKADEKPSGKKVAMSDEAEFYQYQKEQEIAKHFGDYNDAKVKFYADLSAASGLPEDQLQAIIADTALQGGVDVAKAIYAGAKLPTLITELASTTSQIQLNKVLEKAANSIKQREAKRIDSQPEPEINSNGPIDNATRAIEKAREAWVKSPTKANFAAYQEAKKLKGK